MYDKKKGGSSNLNNNELQSHSTVNTLDKMCSHVSKLNKVLEHRTQQESDDQINQYISLGNNERRRNNENQRHNINDGASNVLKKKLTSLLTDRVLFPSVKPRSNEKILKKGELRNAVNRGKVLCLINEISKWRTWEDSQQKLYKLLEDFYFSK